MSKTALFSSTRDNCGQFSLQRGVGRAGCSRALSAAEGIVHEMMSALQWHQAAGEPHKVGKEGGSRRQSAGAASCVCSAG